MPLKDPLSITPFTRPARGTVVLPGSKSITNRALLLGALADGTTLLTAALFSDDTRLMAGALRRLGIPVEEDEPGRRITIHGQGGRIPAERAELEVGLAGTAARFLTALCASAPKGIYRIGGTRQMNSRPMKGLIEALRSLGAGINCLEKEGFLPIEVRAAGLRGGAVTIDASESSQMLSALLMASTLAGSDVSIEISQPVREPFVTMTAELIRQFGGRASADPAVPERFLVRAGKYRSPGLFAIEPDASAASYFLALPLAAGGRLSLPGLRVDGETLQGDAAFAGVLRKAGAEIVGSPQGVEVSVSQGGGGEAPCRDFREFSDTFLTLAAIAPLLRGTTRITGIAHTRKQETDRVGGAARELRKLGQLVSEEEDSLEITPRPLVAGQEIETYGDHRFAMSFGILGCHDLHGDGRPWLSIRNPGCCAKTFPEFFDALESIRRASLAE
jgi:3-phosphoshikimate 1-carboxyvinyltransferase